MKLSVIYIFILTCISASAYYYSGDIEGNGLTGEGSAVERVGLIGEVSGMAPDIGGDILEGEGIEEAHRDRSSRESMLTGDLYSEAYDVPAVEKVEEIRVPDDMHWRDATYIRYSDGTTETIVDR